ncbi:uncharacterized protein J4E88_000844 [Alternaria novae-zelandiae]|uniref:uncharacterized protein n=1 Tax=Alternaria novae-zelandiae TaxID=430562 RepID=UPI0020C5AC65|nr:uncharacterized protein J4E88_000844 [Alternaria novae-zelandiae]KAI4696666.1 hypothetical protein J4E88_000844 [Alternaria novae-zelandiae]
MATTSPPELGLPSSRPKKRYAVALQVFYEENYFDFTSKTSCRAPLKEKHARIVDLSKNGERLREPQAGKKRKAEKEPEPRINMYKDEEGKFNGKVVRRVRRERLWIPQGHLDVLTKPMDARADVRAFLSERSKVLHTSGLPHDTTQSELESWFTQFGGRPVAFWTCKHYHDFAKNTACLRCGASRAGAAVDADLEDQSPSGKKKRKARKKPLSATPVPSVGVVERLSNFYNEHIGPKNLEFAFVDSWDEYKRKGQPHNAANKRQRK